MKENDVKNFIFSSSATVYGTPEYLPLDEKHPTGGCTNPYGKTKYFIEEILKDLSKAEPVSFQSEDVIQKGNWEFYELLPYKQLRYSVTVILTC